jgi:hypothetical protein
VTRFGLGVVAGVVGTVLGWSVLERWVAGVAEQIKAKELDRDIARLLSADYDGEAIGPGEGA